MLWVQIENERVSEVPADGETAVDVYVTFFWNEEILEPERSDTGNYIVNFVIGKGGFPNRDETAAGCLMSLEVDEYGKD